MTTREEVCPEVTRLDQGDIDTEIRNLEFQRQTDACERKFRGRIHATSGDSPPSANRAHVPHNPRSLLAHDGEDGAQDGKLAKHIGVEQGKGFGVGDLLDGTLEDVGGVVEEDVDAAVDAHRFGDDSFDGSVGVGYVELEGCSPEGCEVLKLGPAGIALGGGAGVSLGVNAGGECDGLTAVATTESPRAMAASAIAVPKPDVAPVMNQTLDMFGEIE